MKEKFKIKLNKNMDSKIKAKLMKNLSRKYDEDTGNLEYFYYSNNFIFGDYDFVFRIDTDFKYLRVTISNSNCYFQDLLLAFEKLCKYNIISDKKIKNLHKIGTIEEYNGLFVE